MPGEQPRGTLPPTVTGDLQPCRVAGGTGGPSQPPGEGSAPASRTAKATGIGAQAREPPETQLWQAGEGEPKAPLLRTQSLSSPPGKGGSPRALQGRSQAQARMRRAGRADSSPQQLYSLSITGLRARPALDETPKDPQHEAPRPPEAEAPPAADKLSFQRCFQETPSSFTSTNYTSQSATPRPPPLRAPQSSNSSPCRPASYSEFQASGPDAWPSAAENSFPGASFGVPSTEPEPFPKSGSPGGVSFQFPLPRLHRAGPKPFPEDTTEYAERALVFAFHPPRGAWPEEAVGTGLAYPLPARPAPPPPPCYPRPPGSLEAPSDLAGALPAAGAAHPAPSPFLESMATFPDSVPKSLTRALPERPPSAPDGPQRHIPGQAYGSPRASRVSTSPGSLDTELAAPGPSPSRLPQLWDPSAAPYPTPALGSPATTRNAFFEGQPSPGQQLGLPQSPPLPWPQALPAVRPGPHRMEMLSRLPLPPGVAEWQGGSQGALGAASKTPGPGEKLAVLRNSPGHHGGSSPGLFTYNGLKDPAAQPLFFGVVQPQVSPQGTPGLPPPRVVGASPSESPLPSPATTTAGSSTCSSLSPLSGSPANPSSEESQLPGPLRPSTFYHPPTHPQETSSPFPSPEPSHTLPIHYQPEPVKTFPFPTEGLGAKGAFKCLEEAPFPSTGPEVGSRGLEGFPRDPPPYSAHHFPLSSASLDQLDVLLTCRQCDRNYSSLAAFLEHRQFCNLLLTRAKDSHQQPPGLPMPPAAPSALTTPRALASGSPSLLNHTKMVPFLLGGDVQADGKDDPLRTSFLPGLSAGPFPLPAADLDLEDEAKLDSLITEALNGLEYQSDTPEIDSSFIDVFTDEEPSGPRGPSAGQPPKIRVGAAPESKAQPPLPAMASPLDPQTTCPGDRDYPAHNRPKTRSLGPAPAEADGASRASQQRRGKRFKFRKELDTANTTKRLGRGARATHPRQRRKGDRAEPLMTCPGNLRTQAPNSHTDPNGRALPLETRSSKRLRLSPRKDSRRRKARGGTWSKELIHKIVQQKNKLHRQPAQSSHCSLVTARPPRGPTDGGLQEYDYASESEEEDSSRPRGSRLRGRPRHGGWRWHRGEKRKEVDLTPGPREGGEQQKPRKVVRQDATKGRGSQTPEEPGRPCSGPSESLETQGPPQSPESQAGPQERGPKCLQQVPTSPKTPEENHPSLDFPQETKNPETADKLPPDATALLREVSRSSPATCAGGRPPAPERPQPGREDIVVPRRSSPAPGAGHVLGAPQCTEPLISRDTEDPPAYLPGELLVPVANATNAAFPEPSTLFLKTPDLGCDPALFNRDPVGVPVAKKRPQPYSRSPSELFLEAKDLASCFHEDLYSKPLARHTTPASSMHLHQDTADASSLKPNLPRRPPYTANTDPGEAKSPVTLESPPLFPGLSVDGFDPPIYSSLSGSGDAHSPSACAHPPLRKPPSDPPYPSFLPEKGWSLLEDTCLMLPSHVGHFPDLSAEKAFSKKCPSAGTGAASPPPLPSKVSDCGVAFMSNLSEDELEIKRLVTELESQLKSEDTHTAPGELRGAEHVGAVHAGAGTPLPVPQAAPPHEDALSTAEFTGLGELSPHPEGAERAVAATEGTLGSPQEEWPSFHTREAALPPGSHEDVASGAPFSPTGASLSFQPVQKARASETGSPKTERDCGVHPEVPSPREPHKPPLDVGRSAKCSPSCEPLLPKNNRAPKIHGSEALLLPLPGTQGRGLLPPGACKAHGPCRDPPELEAFSSPIAHLAPDLAFQGARILSLGATPPSGASHHNAPKGHSVSSAGRLEETGLLHPVAGGPGFESDKELVLVGAAPSPACVPDPSPGRRPRDPAASPLHQLQLLVARAAEREDDARGSQGPPPPNAQSPQCNDPSDLEGDSVEGGNLACSPTRGSLGGVPMTAVPAVAGRQPGPEADGHLGVLGQAEKPKGQGQASQLQPDNGGSPGGPGDPTTANASPEAAPARPAGGADQLGGQLQESRVALGLQDEAQAAPSPTSSDAESLVPALAAAHAQSGSEDQTQEEAAGPGLEKHLLLAGESPASPISDLASCDPSLASAATSVPCGLEHPTQEDPPSAPSGELRGLLPASPSCGDPTSPQHLPAPSPVQTPPKRADCTPAPTHPSLRTSPCGLKESLAHCPLLGDRSPLEDPPTGQPSFISVLAPPYGADRPVGRMPRILEGSRKEEPRASPAYASPPPPVRAVSPRVTIKATDLPAILATDGMGAVRGPRAEWPDHHSRGAPPHTSPNKMSKGPSSEPPGNREGHSVPTVPADPCTQEAAAPDPHACLEGEARASPQGQEVLETPGAGRSGITRVSEDGTRRPTVSFTSTELRLGRAVSLSSTASDSRPGSPQSLRNVLHQSPQGDPISLQDPRQKPRGFKKKPVSTENGLWKDQAPSGRPVTCEVCLASFCSGPGLSRHRARKHRLHRGAASQPSPPAPPTSQPGDPEAQTCHPQGKKSHRTSGKEKLRHSLSGPSRTLGPPPVQGSAAPEGAQGPETSKGLRQRLCVLGTPGCPPSREPHSPGLVTQGVDVGAAEPRKRDQLEKKEPRPKPAGKGGGQRRARVPTDVPSEAGGRSNKKARKPRARRFREESGPPVSADVISDTSSWNPSTVIASYPALPSRRVSPEAEQETEVAQPPPMATDPKEMPLQKSPGDWVAHPRRTEGAPPREGPGARKAALARRCWGPRETRTSGVCKEPAGDSRAAESRSGHGVWEGHRPPSGPPGPLETCDSEEGSTISSHLQGPLHDPEDGVQEHEGAAPKAPSPGLGDPLSVFDDEASFSQLFPLGDRWTRKKNPRVYGKRGKKLKPPLPPLEPGHEVGGSTAPSSHLPTDLSDSGSLCLSHEDPWGDEATALPESFLLEGFLSSKVPGIDPWAPHPWALEPGPEAGCAEDRQAESIPKLHMVPAAWRGLDPRAPTGETASPLGSVSPEPPNLEQERYDSGLPGNTVGLETLSAKLEMQDLCFLGPCEDAAGLPDTSFLDFKATANSQEPPGKRTEEAARARRAPGRDRQAKARRAPYKCRVCFQRFHGLGELDLHKLAHSPSPPPTCYMCVERRFGSRELLREHLQEKHPQSKAGLWVCGMCLRELADVWMYNEHLREHAARFAREGQARRSLGALPGCWEGDSSVTHFLSSIMGQASKPHRGTRSIGKTNGAPMEASGHEPGAEKEFPTERAKPKARANNSNQDGALANGNVIVCANPAPPSSCAKTSTSPSPDPCSNREPLLQAVPVHQDCKDPSRDCHHCGKRFPKPFKLQRHLAVHSPQRVYLCPQCPRVYPEHRELRAHLGGEHGVREELELPHTPLYACELCANVTHISKRSFVCSSCNYTFAKKEQFDRHMDKHLRRGQQPFTFRGVRRPGAPGRQAPDREGTLPSKRRRVAVPSSTPGPGVDGPLSQSSSPALSEGSLPALLGPCPDAAPGTTEGQPGSPERPGDPVGHPVGGGSLPSDLQELLPPSLSPFPAASADGKDGRKPDGATESSEDEVSPGSPGPLLQQPLPLRESLPRPGARDEDVEEKRAADPFSGKRRTWSAPGHCAPDHCPAAPCLLRKEKRVSTCHMTPDGGTGSPSHKGSATKPRGCESSSQDRSALSTPSRAPKFPVQPKKAVASPITGEPACGTEDRPKPPTLNARPGPSYQGIEGLRHGTKTAGGSQPQPASGQLQSETATTPAKPDCPGQSPAPDKPLPRAPARGFPKGLREAGDRGPQRSLGPREDREVGEKKRKGRVPGPSRSEGGGGLGRAPSVPDRPPRAPRKQATPSRVLPAKPRPSSQNSRTPPQLWEPRKAEPGHAHGDVRHSKEGLGKAFPPARPLHRPPKRGRAVHGAEPATSRSCRTAESQNDLLSQLFGQRLTSFKIPFKKDPSE
ncbi:zinc finger protein 469 [Diceros bicornis minor]|uniref:zinc finger protein 469 n=1 Tax=Diceros bicornis minor TaxID=77932 RepID=UPI0026F2F822|nr:zinc finger protein 469 [Diceros bicornis minor]